VFASPIAAATACTLAGFVPGARLPPGRGRPGSERACHDRRRRGKATRVEVPPVEGVRRHDLRHTFAALLLSAGPHFTQVSHWLGQSRVSPVVRVQ